jgi:hypothetical protein
MASSVSADLLKQLSVASEALNNVSTIFNEQLQVIEEALGSYNLGVSAWAQACSIDENGTCSDGSEIHFTKQISVGYDKRGGKWCLMASCFIPEWEDHEEWILRDAPRDVRLKAIVGIPGLLEKLIEEAKKLTAEVTKKASEARMLAASIKPKQKTETAK